MESDFQIASTFPQGLFSSFPLGNVLEHDEIVMRLATFVADQARGPSDPEQFVVLTNKAFLQRKAFGPAQQRFGGLVVAIDIFRVGNVRVCQLRKLLIRITDHLR